MDTIFKRIWISMSASDREHLSTEVDSTTNAMRQYADGRRRMSAERAIQVANSLRDMHYAGVRKGWMRPDLFDDE